MIMTSSEQERENLMGRIHASQILLNYTASGLDKYNVCLHIAQEFLATVETKIAAAKVENRDG